MKGKERAGREKEKEKVSHLSFYCNYRHFFKMVSEVAHSQVYM